jgi:hypothetical protein
MEYETFLNAQSIRIRIETIEKHIESISALSDIKNNNHLVINLPWDEDVQELKSDILKSLQNKRSKLFKEFKDIK